MLTYWYPTAAMPLETNVSATPLTRDSLGLHPKVFHEFQPMGGVAATAGAPALPPVPPPVPVAPPPPLPPAGPRPSAPPLAARRPSRSMPRLAARTSCATRAGRSAGLMSADAGAGLTA